jgi:hypothetical protein
MTCAPSPRAIFDFVDSAAGSAGAAAALPRS